MKLRERHCVDDYYGIYPNSRRVFKVDVAHILPKNVKQKTSDTPTNLNQFAHFAADIYTENEERPEIYVYVWFYNLTILFTKIFIIV